MKKLMMLTGLAMASVAAFGEVKIGTVDMMKLVRNHPNYESNKAYLASKEKDFQKKLDAMRTDVKAIEKEGKEKAEQLRNPMLNQVSKTKLENELMEIQQRFLAAQQQLRNEAMRSEQDLQDDQNRFLKMTTDDLRAKITAFSEANGYDMVLDSTSLPYAKKGFDVTDGVLKALGVDPAAAKDPRESSASKEKADEGK